MSAAPAGNRPREDANDDDPSPPLGACSLVIMLFDLVWIWAARLFCFSILPAFAAVAGEGDVRLLPLRAIPVLISCCEI
jgi:hypothetical protein